MDLLCKPQRFPVIVTLVISQIILILILQASPGSAIRCFQCSSDEDKTKDNCGAYENFDTNKNTAVECMGEDAVTPGTFCYKSIQQGPRGFIWDGRWRTVVRRCAQVSERGISWGCDWGYHENGVYWEECYCAEDGCNKSNNLKLHWSILLSFAIIFTVFKINRF